MEIAIIEGAITLIFKHFKSHFDLLQKKTKQKKKKQPFPIMKFTQFEE